VVQSTPHPNLRHVKAPLDPGVAETATAIMGPGGPLTLAATGSPTPSISEKDTLPPGLTFVGGLGTATIAGTPRSSPGHFLIRVQASNGRRPKATQYFTLIVRRSAT
jgi:hypothetical protein